MTDSQRPSDRTATETVDQEHRLQVGLLDALRDAVATPDGDANARDIHARLLDYSRAHFLSEELLMRLHAYDDHERHVADHEEMLDALETFGQDLAEGRRQEAAAAMTRLRAFLLGHIEGRDRELHEHLERSGVGPARG
jgi:hemerythrin